MSTFRETLLAEVSGLCKNLFEHRLSVVKTQQLVSEKAKEDILILIVQLNKLRTLAPFPTKPQVDMAGLAQLKTAIKAADADQTAIQVSLLQWAKGVTGATEEEDEEGATTSTPPSYLNQRMLDNLDTLRSTIDNRRLDLFGQYDLKAYTAARNAYTLSRTIYTERLTLNQIDASGEDSKQMEEVIIPGVAGATGATFPTKIQESADFMSERLFISA